jgi:hypothetical protein
MPRGCGATGTPPLGGALRCGAAADGAAAAGGALRCTGGAAAAGAGGVLRWAGGAAAAGGALRCGGIGMPCCCAGGADMRGSCLGADWVCRASRGGTGAGVMPGDGEGDTGAPHVPWL